MSFDWNALLNHRWRFESDGLTYLAWIALFSFVVHMLLTWLDGSKEMLSRMRVYAGGWKRAEASGNLCEMTWTQRAFALDKVEALDVSHAPAELFWHDAVVTLSNGRAVKPISSWRALFRPASIKALGKLYSEDEFAEMWKGANSAKGARRTFSQAIGAGDSLFVSERLHMISAGDPRPSLLRQLLAWLVFNTLHLAIAGAFVLGSVQVAWNSPWAKAIALGMLAYFLLAPPVMRFVRVNTELSDKRRFYWTWTRASSKIAHAEIDKATALAGS